MRQQKSLYCMADDLKPCDGFTAWSLRDGIKALFGKSA
jgi:hypothetical protein